jgi:GGDEF domain-containing protein
MIAGGGDTSLTAGRVDEIAFEQRVNDEVERAKRFDLGLSLLVIDAADLATASGPSGNRVLDAIRKELRASDLFGRVRGGMLAVVLVHASPEGAESVARRLRRALGSLVDGTHKAAVRLGQAVFSSECKSADALIRQAMRGLDDAGSEG